MPVIEKSPRERSQRERDLFAELVKELRNPQSTGQPVIEIRQMSRGLRHVYVIWDQWDDCAPESRASIVREAFAEVKGPEYEKTIAITVPATGREAAEMGLLPFEVKPFGWYRLDEPARKIATDALMEEGASMNGDSWLPMLRFATKEQAEEAVHRLKQSAPRFEWDVVITRIISS